MHYYFHLTLAPALSLVIAHAIAAAPPPPPDVLDVPPLQFTFAQAAGVSDTTLQRIALEAGPVRPTAFAVLLGDEVRTVSLVPISMRSSDCKLFVQDETGALIDTPLPPITTFRGTIEGEPGSSVAASVIDGHLHAILQMTNGKRLAIEPCARAFPGILDEWHIVYRTDDVLPGHGHCGVTEDHRAALGDGPIEDNPATPMSGIGGTRAEIAFDADFEYYQANGSSTDATIADIEMIMNQVGLIYQNGLPTSMCYEATGFIVRSAEPDPYTTTDPNDLLDEFRDHWDSFVPISRDVAHLFTGKEIDGSVIGIAWLGVVCSPTLAYGLSQSRYSTNLVNRTQLTAHELGHNWNACHCNQSECTDGGTDPDCGVMNSFVQGSLNFGNRARATIEAFRFTRSCLEDCVNTVYVNWQNNGGIEDGSLAFPFGTVQEGVATVTVDGRVIIFDGTYGSAITINKAVTLEPFPNHVVIIGE